MRYTTQAYSSPGTPCAARKEEKPTYQFIIVVGCGRLGSLLASQLSGQGKSVVVIDCDEAAFQNLSTGFSGFQVTGDAEELAVLCRAEIAKADCLLAITRHDNVNLMVAQVAKVIFHVLKVIARVFDPSRETIYRQFGIETICPTTPSARSLVEALRNPPLEGRS